MRNEILKEILSDSELMNKYNLTEKDISNASTNAPYKNKIIEVISVIINENDNHVSSQMIYKKLKKTHNI